MSTSLPWFKELDLIVEVPTPFIYLLFILKYFPSSTETAMQQRPALTEQDFCKRHISSHIQSHLQIRKHIVIDGKHQKTGPDNVIQPRSQLPTRGSSSTCSAASNDYDQLICHLFFHLINVQNVTQQHLNT